MINNTITLKGTWQGANQSCADAKQYIVQKVQYSAEQYIVQKACKYGKVTVS